MFKSGSCVFLLAPGELSSEQTFEYITVYLLSWLKGEKSNLALAQPNEPFSGSWAKETKKNREPTSCCHPLIDISTIHLNVWIISFEISINFFKFRNSFLNRFHASTGFSILISIHFSSFDSYIPSSFFEFFGSSFGFPTIFTVSVWNSRSRTRQYCRYLNIAKGGTSPSLSAWLWSNPAGARRRRAKALRRRAPYRDHRRVTVCKAAL